MKDTPETDSAYIQRPNEGAWDFRVRQEKTMEKLERERDEAREELTAVTEQRDGLLRYNEAFRKETLICADCDSISKEEYDQAIEQRDRLIKSIEPLKYWRDIFECYCCNRLPQGGCLRCDLELILKTTNKGCLSSDNLKKI